MSFIPINVVCDSRPGLLAAIMITSWACRTSYMINNQCFLFDSKANNKILYSLYSAVYLSLLLILNNSLRKLWMLCCGSWCPCHCTKLVSMTRCTASPMVQRAMEQQPLMDIFQFSVF